MFWDCVLENHSASACMICITGVPLVIFFSVQTNCSLQAKIEMDSAVNADNEEWLQVEQAYSNMHEFLKLVPFVGDTDGSDTTECVSDDWSSEVKPEENLAVVKQEPDVCFVIYTGWTKKPDCFDCCN